MDILRSRICQETKLKPSNVKLFIDGQRIQDHETPKGLGLINGDTIELFTEMLGGGWPPNKNIYGDVTKILDILESVSADNEGSDILTDDEEEEITLSTKDKEDALKERIGSNDLPSRVSSPSENIQESVDANGLNVDAERPTENINIELEKHQNGDEIKPKDSATQRYFQNVKLSSNESDSTSSQDKQKDAEFDDVKESTLNNITDTREKITGKETLIDAILTEDLMFVEGLRKQYKDGTLTESNPLDTKIIHYLKLPTLVEIEINQLKAIVERKDVFKDWEKEKNLFDIKIIKKTRKRKLPIVEASTAKQTKTNSRYTRESCLLVHSEEPIESDSKQNKTNYPVIDTPKHRETILSKFSLRTPSPLLKQSKVT